jgi:signal transduction histidine kinase
MTIGVIEAMNKSKGNFTQADVRLLSFLAQWAAIAIENAQLYEHAQAEVTERKRIEKALRQSEEALRQMAQQLVLAQEEERRRLSRELHDDAGQTLTALKIGLELIRSDLPQELDSIHQRMGEAASLAGETLERLRFLAHGLRPPALDTLGLNATMEGMCRDFARDTRLSISYSGAELPSLPDATLICLYRCLQEALTNVAKHAETQRVDVALRCDAEMVSLSVDDDGQGFDPDTLDQQQTGEPDARKAGIGLAGMRERVELLGGRLTISSHPGRGTHLHVQIPSEEVL